MALLLVATVAFTISNLYLGPPTTIRGFNCSTQGCVIAGIASAIGILLGLGGLVVASSELQRRIIRRIDLSLIEARSKLVLRGVRQQQGVGET